MWEEQLFGFIKQRRGQNEGKTYFVKRSVRASSAVSASAGFYHHFWVPSRAAEFALLLQLDSVEGKRAGLTGNNHETYYMYLHVLLYEYLSALLPIRYWIACFEIFPIISFVGNCFCNEIVKNTQLTILFHEEGSSSISFTYFDLKKYTSLNLNYTLTDRII